MGKKLLLTTTTVNCGWDDNDMYQAGINRAERIPNPCDIINQPDTSHQRGLRSDLRGTIHSIKPGAFLNT